MHQVKMRSTAGEEKKGKGLYTLLAVLILVIGLVFIFSISNYRTYEFKDKGDSLTLWKGKFIPKGTEEVESFKSILEADKDLRELSGRRFDNKDEAYKAIFGRLLDQIAEESAKGDHADLSKLNTLLDKAEVVFAMIMGEGRDADGPQFQLAQKRVAIAELTLQEAYRKALPVYQDAVKSGLGDAQELKPKMEAMQTALAGAASEQTDTTIK